MKRNALGAVLLAVGLALVFAAPLAAQDDAKFEAEAKKAFDAGRFKEAGDKYAKAAEVAGVAVERQADLHLQSAWSYYIAGNSKRAREELKAAVTARPDLQVIPDFYSPDFANLAGAVRAEVAGSNVPAYRRRGAQALGAREARRRKGRGGAPGSQARLGLDATRRCSGSRPRPTNASAAPPMRRPPGSARASSKRER